MKKKIIFPLSQQNNKQTMIFSHQNCLLYPYPLNFELVDEKKKIIFPLSQQNNKQTMIFFGKNRELKRFILQF